MKYITQVISCVILCTMLFSCGSTRKITKVDDLSLITNAYTQGDILFLINALEKYPLYRGYTESYLYSYDFSTKSYGHIKQYAKVAQNDVNATIFFDSLLLNKQTITIDSLSNLSIAEVGEFYKENSREHDYLKTILRETYFSDVQSLDYRNRKTLYNAFKDTDLSSDIEQPYHELRDSLLSEIKGVLIPYFNSEREMLTQIEEVVRYESQKYVDAGIEKIISAANEKNDRGLFKKIFKREEIDSYSFKEYINDIINKTYDYTHIEKLTGDRISEYIISSNKLRSMLFNQYFSDNNSKNIYISDTVINKQLVWMIGRGEVEEIQSIKNFGTALTTSALALSAIPIPHVQAVGVAADVADLIYSIWQEKGINQAIEQMANTVYNDSSHCIDNYLTDIFKSLAESQKETENNIIKIFNDEF